MYFLYSLLLTLAFLMLLPYFAWQAVVPRKYVNNIAERLGRFHPDWHNDARPTLWLHAVSVGETLASLPLLKALRAQFPNHRLIISTTTASGQQVARERAVEADGICYFPYDWRFAVRRALAVIRPQAVILMESELWPNFLTECRTQGIPVLVANGRVSDRSFRRAYRMRRLLKPLYCQVSCFLMQTATDAERVLALGANPANVKVSGNLKYDIGAAGLSAKQLTISQDLNKAYSLTTPGASLIIAGSTAENAGEEEEQILLEALRALRKTAVGEHARLLIAPRHPERFAAIAAWLAETEFQVARRSTKQAMPEAEVILLDSIGELGTLYQFAQIVFVGGSLVPKGGHNILEPALYGKPIVVGPHMENFRAITQEFLKREALLQLNTGDRQALAMQLSVAFERLLSDQAYTQRLGANARKTIEANRGATERTVAAVAKLLS